MNREPWALGPPLPGLSLLEQRWIPRYTYRQPGRVSGRPSTSFPDPSKKHSRPRESFIIHY